MKSVKLALLATLLAAGSAVAHAQDVGATVYGNDGNPIGTVESVADGVVTIDTGKHKAPIPANLVGTGETGPSINATKAQIEAMMDQQVADAKAKRDAALVEGAVVLSADGVPAGKVFTIDSEDTVIVQNDQGIVTLTRESFAVNPQGALMALYSAEQLAANTVEVPEGAEILTPAQARAKEAEMAASGDGEAPAGADM